MPPQVVFEILSTGDRRTPAFLNFRFRRHQEMLRKFQFYEKHGVEEYYIYDPYRFELEGFIREGDILNDILEMNGWVSPRMNVRFEIEPGSELRLFDPDGEPFATYLEVVEQAETAEQERAQAEQERSQAEERAEKFAAKLRELGIDPGSVE